MPHWSVDLATPARTGMSSPPAAPTPTDDWRRQIPAADRQRLRRWLWLIVAVVAAIVVVGGITRLTQSGLSIVRWEPIIGVLPPLDQAQWEDRFAQYRQFPEYKALRPDMSLAEFKQIFLWEYLHRLLARGLGLVFAVPFFFFWMRGKLPAPVARRTLALFGLGLAQGLMGWLMVASGLVDRPSVSHLRLAAHLSLAFVIVGAAVWLARDLALEDQQGPAPRGGVRAMTWGLVGVAFLLTLQIVWGALVAGLDAGLGYNTFPLMGGRLVPAAAFATQPALAGLVHHPAGVQWMHRVLGTILLVAAVGLAARARAADVDAQSRRYALGLASGVAGQYLLGVATLLLVVPVPVAIAHQAVALALVGWCVAWFHHLRRGVA